MAALPQYRRSGSPEARAIQTATCGLLHRLPRSAGWILLILLVAGPAGLGSAPASLRQGPAPAGAPFQVIASGFEHPTGLASHPDGFLLLTDRKTGVLYRLTPGFTPAGEPAFTSEVLYSGLDEPSGVAVEPDEHVLVAERDEGRLVRFTKLIGASFSQPEPVAKGSIDPRWLTVDGEGTIFFSAGGIKKEKLPKGMAKPKDDVLLKMAPDGALRVVADGFKELSGMAFDPGGHLFAGAKRRRSDKEQQDGTIVKIRLPDGTVSPVVADGFKQPRDLEVDSLGALFFTADEIHTVSGSTEDDEDDDDDRAESRSSDDRETHRRDEDDREDDDEDEPSQSGKGVILKTTFKEDGTLDRLMLFGGRLGKPEGLAFDREGHLYVAESKHGRLLRFQAPAAPALGSLPRHTNQAILVVGGTAAPNVQITVLGGAALARGDADGSTGAFAMNVSLTPNTEQTLRMFATGSRGEGLTSAATEVTLTHDDVPPDTEISGPTGTLTSPTASFTFTGTDNLTLPSQLHYAHSLDGAPFTPFSTTTTLTLNNLASGSHTLQVKAQDLAENDDPTPAEHTFTVTGLSLTITSPADGASINADRVQVRGTVTGAAEEVGVSVNGFPAQVNNDQWAAEIPLIVGPNTIKATAIEARGPSSIAQITVNVSQAVSPPLQLLATPEGGLAPLTVRFSAQNQTGRSLVRFELDVEGDGAVDVISTTFEDVPVMYSNPGLLYPLLKATDEQGTQYTADTAISVLSRNQMDALLKGKWNGMKAALAANEVEDALFFFAPEQRSRFRTLFMGLSAQIAEIARDMQDIQIISLIENRAKYRLRRTQLYGGQTVTFTYYVYFIQDAAGIWHIEEF